MLYESLQSDFLNTMRVIASYTPKELEQTIEHKRSADEFTDAELQLIAAGSRIVDAGEAEGEERVH